MANNAKELLSKILDDMAQTKYIPINDFPNIDLYMDQVTTFMNHRLSDSKRYEDDKILTKTMINNYAKNQLLPAPDKKKYSREHLLTLIFIYYFKNLLSINDIQKLLNPVLEKYFKPNERYDLSDIYDEIFKLEGKQIPVIQEDIWNKYEMCQSAFEGVSEKEREFLRQFALICELSFDVYYKKLLVERMIDSLEVPKVLQKESKKEPKKEPKKEERKDEKKKSK